MEVRISKSPGLRNDILVVVPRAEVEDVLFHIANRDRLMQLPGLTRHAGQQDSVEKQLLAECKVPMRDHLVALTGAGHGLLGADGKPARRVIAIGSRNVGNNHGYVAWQTDDSPRLFHVRGEPFNYPSYSCIMKQVNGTLAAADLRFRDDHVFQGEADISSRLDWCAFANQVLRGGRPVPLEEIIDQFYDIHHVFAYVREVESGARIETELFEGYPGRFRKNALRIMREKCLPRNKFLHGCLGLSEENIIILQREGTIEEMAHFLREAGAQDGFILENGGSPSFWAWWPYPDGGFLFQAPDYRPNSTAIIAFVLRGPAHTDLPRGSVSHTVL